MNIDVDKDELIKILEDNQAMHFAKYEKAFEKFQQKAIEWFTARLEQFKKGKVPDTYFNLPMPEDHSDDYKQMIDMLEMHKDSTIKISYNEFKNYVNDEWPWTASSTTTTAFYGVT